MQINKMVAIIAIAIAIAITLYLLFRSRNQRQNESNPNPNLLVLDTKLDEITPSKVDNLMIEADLPQNFGYFIELLVNKLIETSKEISETKDYQNGLLLSIKDKFNALNNSVRKNHNGKKLVEHLISKINTCVTNTQIDENDVEKVIDLNENLITIVYPFLLN